MGAGEFGVGDEGDARRDAAEQRVGGDEPAQGPLPGLQSGGTAEHVVAAAAREVEGGGHGAGQGVGEGQLPVRDLTVVAVPGDEQLVGVAARSTAVLVGGGDAALATPGRGDALLVAVGVRRRQVVRSAADREGRQEAVDHGAAGGQVVAVGLDALAGGGGYVAETEVDQGVGDGPGPVGGLGVAGGVQVDPAVGADAGESVAGGDLALLLPAQLDLHGRQRRVGPHQLHALGAVLGGRVLLLLLLLLLAGAAHRRASTSRGMSRAASTRNQAGSSGLPSASEAMTLWATSTEISASCTSSDLARYAV